MSETVAMTLTDFLLARIAEDEADPWRGAELIGTDRIVGSAEADALAAEEREWVARVLAECGAKRRIVEGYRAWFDASESELSDDRYFGWLQGLEEAAQHLAVVYADHPDYDESWRP